MGSSRSLERRPQALASPAMRVGVYVDGFNLCYGGRGLRGKGQPGWRWLDILRWPNSW